MIEELLPRSATRQAGLVADLAIRKSVAGERGGGSSDAASRVLLIEDDPVIAEMYRLQLQVDGYDVEVVSNGTRGWDRIQQQPPDLVLLDIRLPGMDGLTILEAVRHHTTLRSLPIVVLSNFGDTQMMRRARSLGVSDYLIKSHVTPDQVSARIRSWIAGESLN